LVRSPEIFLEVHAGREGFTGAGDDHDLAAVVFLKRVHDRVHFPDDAGVDRITPCRTVKRHPGDAVLEIDGDVVAPLTCGGQLRGRVLCTGHGSAPEFAIEYQVAIYSST